MSSRFGLEKYLAVICALVRFAVCCYRAAHQSIIVDEATTYNKFVSGPWRKLFGRYDANNHIFSSIMVKLSVTLVGLSPFKLRLASLIAGFFLALGVFWLLKGVASWPLRWAAFALVCLHPLLMDFSIAARGYSLSLAFFVWGLYFGMERRYVLAGVLLGLSFAANVAILFPILALLVVIAFFEPKKLLNLALPALLMGALITGPSLRRAHKDDFYTGYPDLKTAVASLSSTSLHARADRDGILGDRDTAEKIGLIGLPIFLVVVGAASLKVVNRRQLMPFLTLAITIIGLVAARWIFGVNYPSDRTGLYFVILAAVSWSVAGDVFKYKAIWLLPAVIVAVQFSTQLQMQYFQFWRVETDDQKIAMLIQQAAAGKAENSLSLSATWMHQPTLEFYRRYLNIAALKPVERFDPTPLTGFDFYLLSWGDVERGKQANLQTIFADPETEVILATSSASSRAGN